MPTDHPLDVQVGGKHYKGTGMQPIELCERACLGACESAIVKYVARHREKGGREDLEKCVHYARLLNHFTYGQGSWWKGTFRPLLRLFSRRSVVLLEYVDANATNELEAHILDLVVNHTCDSELVLLGLNLQQLRDDEYGLAER